MVEINSKTLIEALQNLRDGFKFSIIDTLTLFLLFLSLTIASFSFPYLFYIFYIWLVAPFIVLFCFIEGSTKRIHAWRTLNLKKVEYALDLGTLFLILFCIPVCNPMYWIAQILPVEFRSFHLLFAFWLPPSIIWAIYTFMETKGLRRIEENFHINLSLPRKLNMLGIVFFALGIAFIGYFPFIPSGYPILFGFPFLIASCISSIKKLDKFIKGSICQ